MADSAPPAAAGSEAPKEPSKNALKKAQKEKEKAEKKAAAKARELAERQKQQATAAEDISKDAYGELPLCGSKDFKPTGTRRSDLSDIEKLEDKEITFRCWVENARPQGAKLAFLNLRQGLNTIQAVVAASEQLSKQMVKFAQNVRCAKPSQQSYPSSVY
jgi:aspartyl-tRNA synthetase